MIIKTIVDQIFSINSYYLNRKKMGPYYRGWIEEALKNGKIKYISQDDIIIAFMSFSILKVKPFITLQKIAVHPDFLGKGHGKKLLSELIELAGEKNVDIQTRVAKINEEAISFYEKNGFIIQDDLKNDYTIRMVKKCVKM